MTDNIVSIQHARLNRLQAKADVITDGSKDKAKAILTALGMSEETIDFCLNCTKVEDWLDFIQSVTDAASVLGKRIHYKTPERDDENLAKLVSYYRDNLQTMPPEEAALQAVIKPWRDEGCDEDFITHHQYDFAQAALLVIDLANKEEEKGTS
jgi:hypothetical protein